MAKYTLANNSLLTSDKQVFDTIMIANSTGGIVSSFGSTTTTTPTAVPALASNNFENYHVFKTTPGNVFSISATIGNTSGWLLLLDANAAPANVTALTTVPPLDRIFIYSDGTRGYGTLSYTNPISTTNGVVAVFTTSNAFGYTSTNPGNTTIYTGQVL